MRSISPISFITSKHSNVDGYEHYSRIDWNASVVDYFGSREPITACAVGVSTHSDVGISIFVERDDFSDYFVLRVWRFSRDNQRG